MYCVVFHSTTKGKPSRVTNCGLSKGEAEREKLRLNRGEGFGGFWSIHPESVVARWAKAPQHHQFVFEIDPDRLLSGRWVARR